MIVPDRGDIIHVSLDPTKGHEQSGVRPAVVLSPAVYNRKSGLLLACPITTHVKNYPFEVEVQSSNVHGVILADQVRCLDWKARHVKIIDRMAPSGVSEILAKTSALLSPLS